MECHLSEGEGAGLVREVEMFLLDIVALTMTHSKGSGTSLLQRGWTLFHFRVVKYERQRGGVQAVGKIQHIHPFWIP